MNPDFLPNKLEEGLIQTIHKYCRNEFVLIRMTRTMLEKSIIDASEGFRIILKDNDIVDYYDIPQGEKIMGHCYLAVYGEIDKKKMSLYRPVTKKGDPRFWIYGLGSEVDTGDLIYLTVYDGQIFAIPLIPHKYFEKMLVSIFGINEEDDFILAELIGKIARIKELGWIESVSPYISNPKDVGETFEKAVGISPNNLIGADYKGQIEIKTKRLGGNTLDTLFSKVPDWDISNIKSSNEMILRYGYPSNKEKYEGFYDLYITVGNRPNNQGLYIFSDDDSQRIYQNYFAEGVSEECCKWEYSAVKKTLNEKHPKTVWIAADERIIDGKIHFKYKKVELTQKPIFSQFTSLINKGIVTYDWRGRVRTNGTGYKDKGHCFRVSPKNRNLLFGDTKEVEF